jgi:hypothetical protein
MKRFALFCFAAVLLTLGFAVSVCAADSISVFMNYKSVEFDQEPFIENGRLLVPIRAIAEAAGMEVAWSPSSRAVMLTKTERLLAIPMSVDEPYVDGKHTVELTIDSDQALVDNEPQTLEVSAKIVGGRTYIPLRFISEAIDMDVSWIENSEMGVRVVVISNRSRGIKTQSGSLVFPSLQGEISSIVIEGVTYRTGFYGDLYPVFGEVGDIGTETLQREIVYEYVTHEFRRVDFEGHDWVHSYIGEYTGGTVYCAESQWEQMRDYYADPANFEYYYSVSGEVVDIPEIDPQKFDQLVAFGNENNYKPFSQSSNEKVMQKARRMPESQFHEGVGFGKVSKDGYFLEMASQYFVNDGKLLLLFRHDFGTYNGGIEEVIAVDVPDELGQYFIDLLERYPNTSSEKDF